MSKESKIGIIVIIMCFIMAFTVIIVRSKTLHPRDNIGKTVLLGNEKLIIVDWNGNRYRLSNGLLCDQRFTESIIIVDNGRP